jgi:hypothetical protein
MEENSLQRNSKNIARKLGLRGSFLLSTILSIKEDSNDHGSSQGYDP